MSQGSQAHVCNHVFRAIQVWLGRYIVVMVSSIDLSLAIVAIDILTALISSLKHGRKHVPRLLRLYGDQKAYISKNSSCSTSSSLHH